MKTASLYFSRSVSAEFLKLKSTAALWLTLAGPLLAVFLNFCIIYFKGQFIVKPGDAAWETWHGMNLNIGMMLLMPFYLILLNVLVQQLDHKNNTHKLLFSFALPKSSVYFSRALMVISLYVLSLITFVVLLLSFGFILSILRSDLSFSQAFISNESWWKLLRAFLGGFSILGIHYWMSFRWKNVIVPIGIGVAGFISCVSLANWEYSIYLPYFYQSTAIGSQQTLGGIFPQLLNVQTLLSTGVGLFFIVGGYFEMRRRDVI